MDDSQRAEDRPPSAFRMQAGDGGDSGEPDCEPNDPDAARPLARRDPERQQRDEDRNGRVRDRGDPGVDVRLPPRDEEERDRHPHHADEGARPECRPDRARPRRPATNATSTAAASSSRSSTIAAGEKSRRPTLMNMYDEPQIAESTSSSGTYERVTSRMLGGYFAGSDRAYATPRSTHWPSSPSVRTSSESTRSHPASTVRASPWAERSSSRRARRTGRGRREPGCRLGRLPRLPCSRRRETRGRRTSSSPSRPTRGRRAPECGAPAPRRTPPRDRTSVRSAWHRAIEGQPQPALVAPFVFRRRPI
jgi:hypothetical protein